jgi:hypothetical protein
LANLLIPRIEDQVFDLAQRPGAPGFEFLVERSGGAADLAAGDLAAAEFLDDLGHLPRGDALHVHLGQGQRERFLAPHAALQRPRIKLHPPDLRHRQFEFADPRLDMLGLETVRLALALVAALVRRGAQRLLTLDLHALVEQHLHRRGHAVEALLGQRLENLVETRRIHAVGHGWSPLC